MPCATGSTAPSELSGTGPLAWDGYCDRALDSLRSAEAAGAFRIDREDPRLRDRYGRNIHGQCLLLARRLIEAGVPLVTVNWHDDHSNFWDTHGDNFNQLKNRLMPPADQGLSALLDDLESRGLLDETLIVWVGEFGRKPHITAGNAGREHWPHCYTRRPGRRRHPRRARSTAPPTAGPPTRPAIRSAPTTSAPRSSTRLGIDPATEVRDPVGRPLRINSGSPLTALFG